MLCLTACRLSSTRLLLPYALTSLSLLSCFEPLTVVQDALNNVRRINVLEGMFGDLRKNPQALRVRVGVEVQRHEARAAVIHDRGHALRYSLEKWLRGRKGGAEDDSVNVLSRLR